MERAGVIDLEQLDASSWKSLEAIALARGFVTLERFGCEGEVLVVSWREGRRDSSIHLPMSDPENRERDLRHLGRRLGLDLGEDLRARAIPQGAHRPAGEHQASEAELLELIRRLAQHVPLDSPTGRWADAVLRGVPAPEPAPTDPTVRQIRLRRPSRWSRWLLRQIADDVAAAPVE